MSESKPIVVALSGGVDSATAAAVLVEQGHRVVAMTMRLYNAAGSEAAVGGRCCGPRDIEDARRVCEHLDIPHYVVDLESTFTQRVVDDFVDAYLTGETPNPCARCNQHIKFTPLLQRARAIGADCIVTGHYARIERDAQGAHRLLRGVDRGKDQSYFLFAMPSAELPVVQFPLGAMTKQEVRALAEKYRLPNACKAESQEICFVPDGDYAGFVAKAALVRGRELRPGPMLDQQGQVVGEHAGIHHYTVGQRRGLGGGNPEPTFVIDVDAQRNAVVVGGRADAETRELSVRDFSWLGPPPAADAEMAVQVRYRAQPSRARIVVEGTRARMQFLDEAVIAAPGQAAVVYSGDTVLGGGWIARA